MKKNLNYYIKSVIDSIIDDSFIELVEDENYEEYSFPIISLAFLTKIDFKRSHAPLLLTSGSNDKLISSVVSYCNYKKYSDRNFMGYTIHRSQLLLGLGMSAISDAGNAFV